MDNNHLSGVALITGASSGVGRGTAFSYAKAGCTKLFLGDINISGLQETQSLIITHFPLIKVQIQHVDTAKEESVDSFVESCVAAFGRIDYANNIAGVVPQRVPLPEVELSTYDRVIDVNLFGTWLCHRAEIRQMLKQNPLEENGGIRGSITSVSSLSGINASPGMSPYCASKHGIIGICKTDAQDYGPQGIRINAVCPGMIDTELFRKTSLPGMAERMETITPLRILGKPEDVGDAMVWLSGTHASFISGASLIVDGGLSLHRY